jgi:hypothetical protein
MIFQTKNKTIKVIKDLSNSIIVINYKKTPCLLSVFFLKHLSMCFKKVKCYGTYINKSFSNLLKTKLPVDYQKFKFMLSLLKKFKITNGIKNSL